MKTVTLYKRLQSLSKLDLRTEESLLVALQVFFPKSGGHDYKLGFNFKDQSRKDKSDCTRKLTCKAELLIRVEEDKAKVIKGTASIKAGSGCIESSSELEQYQKLLKAAAVRALIRKLKGGRKDETRNSLREA